MALTSEQEKLWFDLKLVPGAKFKLNDPVNIVRGQFRGRGGSIISLENISEDPSYYVELENGETVKITESLMELSE